MTREECRGLTAFIVILLIFSAFFVIGTATASTSDPEQNVCRDLPAEAQPGDEITVELAITADGADRIIIDDMVPAGWTVTGASDGGVPEGNHVRWAKFGGDFVDTTYTYTVRIPGDAALGLHTFSGVYNLGSGSNAIDCDLSITIEVTSGDSSDSNNLETATIDEQEITTVNDQETATVNDPDPETDDESSSASTESASNTHKSVATTQSTDDSAEEVPAAAEDAGSSMLVIVIGAIVIVSYKLKEN